MATSTGAVLSEAERQTLYHMAEIEGVAFGDLATLFGLSSAREAREIYADVREDNKKNARNNSDAMRTIQHQRYEDLFRESRREFGLSKRDKTTVTTRKDPSGNITGSEVRVETQNGDPRLMRMAMDCARSIDALFGLDAPKSVKIDTHSTHDVYINLEAMPTEELEQHALLAKLRRQGLLVLDQAPLPQAQRLTENKRPHDELPLEQSQPVAEELQTPQPSPPEGGDGAFRFQSEWPGRSS